MKNSRLASWKTALPFLLPSLAGFVVFSIIPMIMQIFVSLTSWDGLSELTLFSDFSGFMNRFYVGIENYKEILTSKEFYQVIGNTLEFVILYIPLMLIASMIVALILNSHVKGVGIFRVLYYIPVITSWVAGALIWKWVLSPEYGAINNILALFGIEGPSWLQSSKWAMPAIVLASVWKDMGYFGLMLMSGLQGINQEYYDAAAIDGAGKIKQFTRITLPLLTPTLFFVLIISLINSFQLFTQIMIMTPDGGPLGSTMVMVERIYKCGLNAFMLLQLFNAFAIFMMRQKMMTINDAYIEAAVIDGASMWRIFFKIILPMSGSAMATLAILAFMDMWNDYLLPLVLLSERSKFTLPLLLSTLSGQYKNQYNLTMAGALISIIPILIVYIFAQKYFKYGLKAARRAPQFSKR